MTIIHLELLEMPNENTIHIKIYIFSSQKSLNFLNGLYLWLVYINYYFSVSVSMYFSFVVSLTTVKVIIVITNFASVNEILTGAWNGRMLGNFLLGTAVNTK